MTTARLPWEFHPALTAERLAVCARLLVQARRDAVTLARAALGDDSWSIGCRAFAFGRERLRRAAEGRLYPWMRVLDGSHHFVFLIEDVPVRFYRGPADDAPERTLKRQEQEATQLRLALGREEAEGLAFRLAVETGPDGRASRIVFLALRGEDGLAECFWPVPLPETRATGPRAADQLSLMVEETAPLPRPRRRKPRVPERLPAPRAAGEAMSG
ncbi:MAG: hypothetical protein K2X11_10050 [Acetobacteraceae bacterium]|nr:hypothetical protein [Acetobacteraceae bacterium]